MGVRGERVPGVIEAGAVYTAAEFRRRAGLGDYAWRKIRREIVTTIGRKQYVHGAAWLRYVERQGAGEN